MHDQVKYEAYKNIRESAGKLIAMIRKYQMHGVIENDDEYNEALDNVADAFLWAHTGEVFAERGPIG